MINFIHAQFYSKFVYNTAEPNNIDEKYLIIYLFMIYLTMLSKTQITQHTITNKEVIYDK
jgi:hypothetical protein